jgi:exodeoxyribonuclease VII large subunit
VKSLAALNAQKQADVIIVARGGGSLEDLWAFNDEGVVRAIADSQIPVITGIGHETDFTLADFAADVRAATPTAAAEQAVPDAAEIKAKLSDMANLLSATIRQICGAQRGRIQDSARRLELQSPLWRVRNDRQRIDELQARIANNQAHRLELLRSSLVHLQKRLVNLSPQAVLQRGYAIIKTAEGVLVKSVRQVHREDVLDIRVADGAILSKVLTEPTTEHNGGIADG